MDFLWSDDGDLVIENNSLASAPSIAVEKKQFIMNRILTNAPDWRLHPWLGANLDDLRGESVSKKTSETGTILIREALTQDSPLLSGDIIIESVPGPGFIDFFICVYDNDTKEPIVFDYRMVVA